MPKYSVDILLQVVDTGARAVLNSFGAAVKENFKDFSKPKLGSEGVAKVGLMTSAAINAADIAMEAFSGDITDAGELVKRLPFGIGQMATALEGILGKWTGITEEIARNEALVKSMIASSEAIAQQAKTRRDFEKETADFIKEQKNAKELADIGASSSVTGDADAAKSSASMRQSEAAALAAVEKQAKERQARALEERNKASQATMAGAETASGRLGGVASGGAAGTKEYERNAALREATRGQRAGISANYEKQKAEIEAQAEQAKKAVQERFAAERAEAEKKQREKQSQDDAQAAEESAKYNEDMQKQENAALSELKAKQLEDTNQMLDAEKERIRQSYKDKIKSAEDANEKITADALRAQMALDIKKAERTDLERRSPAIDKLIKESEQTYLDRKKLMTVDPMQTAASIISSSLSRVPGSGSAKSESLLTGIKEVLGDTKRLTERMTRSIERGFLVPAGF